MVIEINDQTFENEVIKSKYTGSSRLLGAMVRPMPISSAGNRKTGGSLCG